MANYKRTKMAVKRLEGERALLSEQLDRAVADGDIPEAKRLRGLIAENERTVEELWEECDNRG